MITIISDSRLAVGLVHSIYNTKHKHLLDILTAVNSVVTALNNNGVVLLPLTYKQLNNNDVTNTAVTINKQTQLKIIWRSRRINKAGHYITKKLGR